MLLCICCMCKLCQTKMYRHPKITTKPHFSPKQGHWSAAVTTSITCLWAIFRWFGDRGVHTLLSILYIVRDCMVHWVVVGTERESKQNRHQQKIQLSHHWSPLNNNSVFPKRDAVSVCARLLLFFVCICVCPGWCSRSVALKCRHASPQIQINSDSEEEERKIMFQNNKRKLR